MRIGLFAHRLAKTDPTGVHRYFHELVLALADASQPGESIVVAAPPEPRTPNWIPSSIETQVLNWPRRPVQALWSLGAGPRLERAAGRLDVAHLLDPFPPVPTRAPEIVTVHDVMPFEHPEWYPRSELLWFRRAMALALRRASRIVVPSAYVADRLTAVRDVDPARIAVIPHGVTGTFMREHPSVDAAATCARLGVEPGRFVVCVGQVSTRKNLIPVIRALATPGAGTLPLLIIGADGHGVEQTEAEIAKLDHGARARRTGYLSDDQTAALVRNAAVLVHPALEEGFGLVPLEAMAAGTPVIAGRVSSIPEVVGDAAVLVDEPAKPTAWAEALAEVSSSDARREALSAAGRARAATFSWQRTAASVLSVYRDVARG